MTAPRTLPTALVDHARQFVASRLTPVEARPASSVLLLRDSGAGLQVYLLRRRTSMAFAGGMHAFPGGAVDPRDGDDEGLGWLGRPPSWWADRLATSEAAARGFVCAAVRETFEESGVLLVTGDDGVPAPPAGSDWEADRRALVERRLALSDLLDRRGLAVRSDVLAPWAHWVTPRFEPRRYDTWFFLAALPLGQRARDLSGEADQVTWMRPVDAVSAAERGEVVMLPPTWSVLEDLVAYGTVAEALDAAEARSLATVTPGWVDDGAGIRLLLPGDPGYPGDDPGEA
ncbi:MAG TPA: NUDIX hydrolase [Jiangellaceae bacterium]|nr:NUDIX hydrolase [Jiangellaceae bacterium]